MNTIIITREQERKLIMKEDRTEEKALNVPRTRAIENLLELDAEENDSLFEIESEYNY